MIYDHVFTPFRIADGRCTVAPESEWQNVKAASQVLVDADLFQEWKGNVHDNEGRTLWWDNDDKTLCATTTPNDGEYRNTATIDDFRRRVFSLIDATPATTWIVRTERPENVERMMPPLRVRSARDMSARALEYGADYEEITRPNLWLGVTARTQAELDERLPKLLNIPAAKRFVDLVPTEAIDLSKKLGRHWECPECGDDDVNGKWPITDKRTYYCGLCAEDCGRDVRLRVGKHVIDWVAVRGDADPLHPDWVRSLRDQATSAGVPFAFETWGEWAHTEQSKEGLSVMAGDEWRTWLIDDDIKNWPDGSSSYCVGDKYSGRQLDGREWSEVPA